MQRVILMLAQLILLDHQKLPQVVVMGVVQCGVGRSRTNMSVIGQMPKHQSLAGIQYPELGGSLVTASCRPSASGNRLGLATP